MIKLHYAELTNDGDIPCYKFDKPREVVRFLDSNTNISNKDRVYLITGNDNHNDIFITENVIFAWDFYLKFLAASDTVFWQEYPSFEDAYSVALDIKETSNLCYN
jgi:hypothetical protein